MDLKAFLKKRIVGAVGVAALLLVGTGCGAAAAPAATSHSGQPALTALNNGPQQALRGITLNDPHLVAACHTLAARYQALSHHHYVIGIEPSTPGQDYRDPNDPSVILGMHPAMAEATMDCLAWPFSFKAFSFDGLIPAVQSGRADIQWRPLFYSSQRAKVVNYIVYMKVPDVAIVDKGKERTLRTLSDLCGKTVGVAVGSVEQVRFEKHPPCGAGTPSLHLVTFPSVADVVEALRAGRVQVAVFGLAGAQSVIHSPGVPLAVRFVLPGGYELGLSVRKHDTTLLQALYQAIKLLQKYHIQQHLMAKYGDSNLEYLPAAIRQ